MAFQVFHGITLAENSFIENLNVEVLGADPVPVGPGRIWFNSTDKAFKFSGLDATGAVVVRSFKDAESAATELSALQAAVAAEKTRAEGVEAGLTAAVAAEKTRAEGAEAGLNTKIDAVKAELLGGIPPETLDTITELAAALRDNPDIVTVLETKIGTDIAAAKAELKGAVSGAFDTLGELEAGLAQEVADRTAAVAAEKLRAETAEAGLNDRLTSVEGATNGKVGDLATLHTDVKTTLVGAINEVQDEVAAEVARAVAKDTELDGKIAAEKTRAEGVEAGLNTKIDNEIARATTAEQEAAARAFAVEGALNDAIAQEVADRTAAVAAEATARTAAVAGLKSQINAGRFTFQSTAAATVHTIVHGLGSSFVDATLWIERDGTYRNDMAAMEEVDSNTIKVTLSSSAKIKVVVESIDQLA